MKPCIHHEAVHTSCISDMPRNLLLAFYIFLVARPRLDETSPCLRQGLFGEEAFKKIKKGARIINVARGGVIDDAALAAALEAGQVAAAALDVFVKEPPPADHPLVGRADVICTPHLGASTEEAQEEVAIEIAEVVIKALQVGTGCHSVLNGSCLWSKLH